MVSCGRKTKHLPSAGFTEEEEEEEEEEAGAFQFIHSFTFYI
jgi:hypothetical protein